MATLQGNYTTWRIASGTLKKGRESDGTLETRDNIEGILKSVSYFEGEDDNGEAYAQVEANLEDSDGESFRVKVGIGLNPTSANVTGLHFIQGLLDCQEGDDIAFFPQLAKNPTKYGNKITYVTVGKCVKGDQYKPIFRKKDQFPGESSREQFKYALEAFKQHPAYKERERNLPDADLSVFGDITGKNEQGIAFPNPSIPLVKKAYLDILSKLQGGTVTEYEQATPDTLEKLREAWKTAPEVPAKLAKAAKEAEAQAAKATDEYDPFADE